MPAPVPREVVSALAAWVDDQAGPTHNQLEEAILASGIAVPEGIMNKPTKVKQAFAQASPTQGHKLVDELIHLIRERDWWDRAGYERKAARTKAAIQIMGAHVSDEGFLTWPTAIGDVVMASTPSSAALPSAPPSIAHEPAPAPAPPVTQTVGSTNVSHERLLWLLRRVPASFSALVAGRRSGHDPLVLADEYDLQDATETALRLLYNDVRPEERSPSYAGSSTTQDFLLFEVRTMVEIKVTRPGRGNVKIREEIDIDSMAYLAHPNVDRMVFVVYDLAATIANPSGFEHDLSTPINGHERNSLVVPWPYPVSGVSRGN